MSDKVTNRMFCKKCGEDITFGYGMIPLKNEAFLHTLPTNIVEIYEGFTYAPACAKCWEIIDYKELEIGSFWEWLKHATEGIKDSKLKGKAVIRYFELPELLQCNTTKEV